MYQHNTFLLLLAAAFPVAAQSPYAVAPQNYRLEFENESVRVSRASFAPGDRLPIHDHPAAPAVFVYLTDGGPIRFTHITPAFTVERAPVERGGIRFHSGAKETHIVDYLGDRPSEYLRIELKTERPDKQVQHVRIAATDHKPFENGQLRISRSLCAGRDSCGHLDFAAVIVNLSDRSVAWYAAGDTVRNGKDDPALQIRIELKTKPAGLAR
jgi:hypothetical protein